MRVPVWVGRADAGRVDATRRLAGSAGGGVADTPPPPTRATAGCMACVGAAAGGRVAGGGASPAGLANMDSGSTATGDRSRTTAPDEAGCVGGDETDATPANFMAGLELAGTATAAGAATSAAGDAPPPCAVASAPDSPPSDMLRVQETRETSAGRRRIAARRSQGREGKRPKSRTPPRKTVCALHDAISFGRLQAHAVSDFDRNTNRSTPVVVQTSAYDLVEPARGHGYGFVTPLPWLKLRKHTAPQWRHTRWHRLWYTVPTARQ